MNVSEYKPGDQVNGYVLTQENQWVPIAMPAQPKSLSTKQVLAIVAASALALVLLIMAVRANAANDAKINQARWCTETANAINDWMVGDAPEPTFTDESRYDEECQ